MYRFVIEHPRWIPPDRLKSLDVRAGANKGRIYRVYPTAAKLRPFRDLTKLKEPLLLEALDTPNGPTRDLVHRLILERAATGAFQAGPKLPWSSRNPAVRFQCLSLAAALNPATTKDLIAGGLEDSDPRVRQLAVRLHEPLLRQDPSLGQTLLQLLEEPSSGTRGKQFASSSASGNDPGGRFQLALSLGEWDDPRAGETLAQLAQTGDRWLHAAVLSSAQPHWRKILKAVGDWPASTPGRGEFSAQLCSLAAVSHDSRDLALAL